jgi:phosphatidylglycerophosphate synthase
VTHVLLFATQATADGNTTALLPRDSSTVVESLIGTMRSLDVEAITVITRPAWAGALRDRGIDVVESADVAGDLAVVASVSTSGSVVLAAADLVAHRAALAKLAGVRVARTVAAITMSSGGFAAQPIMRQRDQVISVETHAHDVTGPNAFFRGMLAVGPSDREHLVAACAALTDYSTDLDPVAGDFGAVGLVLLALVRADVPVAAYSVRYLHMTRVASDVEAKAASDRVASTDEENASLQASKKEDEEFLATYLVQSYTPYWVRFFARHGISPNMVTWSSVVVAAGATAAFITTSRALWVLGAVLLYLSFILDCCDGGVARVTGKSSRYGGWFDMISDRIKEYGVYAGLAIGGVRAGYSGMWALALTAMVLMTVRHMVDTWYNALQATATRSLPAVPLASRDDRLAIRAQAALTSGAAASGGAARIGTTLGQLSATAHGNYRSPAYWLKRSVVLPIGDRWLIIAITAAIWGPKVSFIVLLCCIVLAFAYIFSGRTLRALSMRISVMPRFDIALQRDDGLVALILGRRLPPLPITFPAIIAALVALVFDIADHPPHDGDGRMWLAVGLGILALGSVLGARAAHDGSLDWLVPAALRAVEYTFIVVAGLYNGVPQPLIYGLIATITLVHYEISSRTEKAATPMGNLRAALGWDGRIVVIAVTTAIGLATAGFAALTVLVGAVLVIEMLAGLLRRRPV